MTVTPRSNEHTIHAAGSWYILECCGASPPTDSPSRGGDVTAYVYDINQPSFPTPFNFVLVSVSVFMALSTVFESVISPDNSPFSHSVLPV